MNGAVFFGSARGVCVIRIALLFVLVFIVDSVLGGLLYICFMVPFGASCCRDFSALAMCSCCFLAVGSGFL